MAGHDQYSSGKGFWGLIVTAAADKGATSHPAGGRIEALACADSGIDQQTESGEQTKMVKATSTFSKEKSSS